MEVDLCGFQETILKIIKVEKDTIYIKFGLRITIGEVESNSTTELHIRQLANGTFQQFLLFQRVSATGLSTTANGIEKRHTAQVGLKVTQLIVAGCQDLGNRQLTTVKMFRQIDKSMIFVTTRSNHTNHRLSFMVSHAEISTVTTSTRNLLNISGLSTFPLFIKIYKFLHILLTIHYSLQCNCH